MKWSRKIPIFTNGAGVLPHEPLLENTSLDEWRRVREGRTQGGVMRLDLRMNLVTGAAAPSSGTARITGTTAPFFDEYFFGAT